MFEGGMCQCLKIADRNIPFDLRDFSFPSPLLGFIPTIGMNPNKRERKH